nr:hypothetical protein [uncultured Rhodopila sp.]
MSSAAGTSAALLRADRFATVQTRFISRLPSACRPGAKAMSALRDVLACPGMAPGGVLSLSTINAISSSINSRVVASVDRNIVMNPMRRFGPVPRDMRRCHSRMCFVSAQAGKLR